MKNRHQFVDVMNYLSCDTLDICADTQSQCFHQACHCGNPVFQSEMPFPRKMNKGYQAIFTVLCSVNWPDSKAEGDLVLIQTSLFLLCKSRYDAN